MASDPKANGVIIHGVKNLCHQDIATPDKSRNFRATWFAAQHFGACQLCNLTIGHNGDTVGQCKRFLLIVGDVKHGHITAPGLDNLAHHVAPELRV